MCGIYGIVCKRKQNLAQKLVLGLKKLEYRGYDSWGIAVSNSSNDKSAIHCYKEVGYVKEDGFSLPLGNIGIGHTRWATHGGITATNTHPHLDCSKKLAVVHNGIIENFSELRHLVNDHPFVSQTDTEVLAHLIEEKQKSMSIVDAVFTVFNSLKGSNAICVLDTVLQQLIVCRNGSPVVLGKTQSDFFVSSDVTPFLDKTKQALFLNDGEGAVINSETITVYNYKTGRKIRSVYKLLNEEVTGAEKGDYPHFLLKEIMEQSKILSVLYPGNEEALAHVAQDLRGGKQVLLIGCGTSEHAALTAQYFFAHVGIQAEVYGAYEFLPFAQFCDKNTVCIVISQSGETADSLIAARAAKAAGARLVTIVNAPFSTLERMADVVIRCHVGPEIAVVSTKAFTAQVGLLYLLSQVVGGKQQEAVQHLLRLQQQLTTWMTPHLLLKIKKMVNRLAKKRNLYLIGKHEHYPAALECALKVKETSYLHAEAFSCGELKHGVISLIEAGEVCIVLNSNDEVKTEVLSSAAEVKVRNGTLIGIGPVVDQLFDLSIQTPDLGCLTVIPNVIVGQLLGYYLAVYRGVNPDKPRNLAKSVTVK